MPSLALLFDILAVDRASPVFDRVGKAAATTHGEMGRLAGIGKAAFLALGTAAVSGSVLAIKSAADFQESLTQLVTGAGESEKNIKLVGDGMLKMAGKVGFSAKDLSKGMYLIESSGQHGAAGLLVLKAAAEGARVGAADMESVANGLTTALNDYRLPASAAAKVTSQLVATVAAGKTHMADLASSLATVLPAASAAHIGLAQVLGAMATMTSLGTPAADAATYLKQTISNLANPTAKARHEMEALGLSSLDVSKNLGARGLTGTFDILTHAIVSKMGPAGTVLIESLRKSSGSTTAFQKILANLSPTQQTYIAALATMVGGTKSMQAALELTGSNAKTFNANVKDIGSTTTEAGGHVKGFALTQKDLNTKLDNVKAAFGSLLIKVGQDLIPIIEKATEIFKKHTTAAAAVALTIGGALVTAIGVYIVTTIVATATTIIQTTATIVGNIAFATFAVRYYAVAAASKVATAASAVFTAGQWLLNAALSANPIGLVIVAIGLLVAGLIIAWRHSQTFRDIVRSAFRMAADAVLGSVLAIMGVLESFYRAMGHIPGVGGMFRGVANEIHNARGAVQALKNVIDGLPTHKELVYAIRTNVETVYNSIQAAGSTSSPTTMKMRAGGGSINAGEVYRVGERESEFFVSDKAGQILNQRQARAAGLTGGSGRGDTHNWNLTTSADPIAIAHEQAWLMKVGAL